MRLVSLDEPEAAVGEPSASGSSSVPAPASELPSLPGALFVCEIDESAGLRGAYWDDAA